MIVTFFRLIMELTMAMSIAHFKGEEVQNPYLGLNQEQSSNKAIVV